MFRWLFWFRFDEQLAFEADLLLVLHSHTKKCGKVIQFLSHVSVQQSHVSFASTEMSMHRSKADLTRVELQLTPRRRNSLHPIHESLRLPYIDQPHFDETRRIGGVTFSLEPLRRRKHGHPDWSLLHSCISDWRRDSPYPTDI